MHLNKQSKFDLEESTGTETLLPNRNEISGFPIDQTSEALNENPFNSMNFDSNRPKTEKEVKSLSLYAYLCLRQVFEKIFH